MHILMAVLSDTHGRHREVKIPDADLLVHCGDLASHAAAVIDFNAWLGTLPHRWKIIVAGNHDEVFQYEPERARALITNAVYLEDSETTVAGLRIYGSPWQPEFNGWHFNLPRGEALRAKWDLIPGGGVIDILVTHGPPHGVLDEVSPGRHVGCEDLKAAVERVAPKYHLFGHVHEAYGIVKSPGRISVNACILDRQYQVARPPRILRVPIGPRTEPGAG